MKTFKIFFLATVCAIGLNTSVHAQKTAHINADQLIFSMPESRALQVEMESLKNAYNDKIIDMENKLEAKAQKYTSESATQTQTVNEQRVQEVEQERVRISRAKLAAYEELEKTKAERLTPILAKAEQAINDVANDKGIIYVFDASAGKGLLVVKGEDIYEAVKAKLGF